MYGLEMHLVVITKLILEFKPKTVVIDPITNLVTVGSPGEVQSILTRLLDFMQQHHITVLFTGLAASAPTAGDQTDETISSLVDTWIQVRDVELNGERNRALYIMKSRGIKHSNQVREFIISNKGLTLEEVYLGPMGVLTGSAKLAHALQQQTDKALRNQLWERNTKEIKRRARELDLKISALTSEFDAAKENLLKDFENEELKDQILETKRTELGLYRGNFPGAKKKK